MKKEKKLVILVLFLILLVFLLHKVLSFSSIYYSLSISGKKASIKEYYNDDNYYIEINIEKNVYPFRIYESLNNKRKIVKDIYFYKDENVECILPIIDGDIYTDLMCFKDSILYDYSKIIGEIPNLDKFVDNIQLYDTNNFEIESSSVKSVENIKYNIYDNVKKTVAITTYNGLMIDGEILNLFKNDVYNNKISTFSYNYYLVADYENDYSFNTFYFVNLLNKKVSKLDLKEDISFDSYIQGIVDDNVYLYDKDNENQYKINLKNKTIDLISSSNYIKYYSNKSWNKLSKARANKYIYFDYDTLDNIFPNYDLVKESDNYYYLFKKDGISYRLYRADKSNINVIKYILDVPTTNIEFKKDYLYYVYKTKMYYYSDSTNLKILLEDSELEFNDTIKYYVY